MQGPSGKGSSKHSSTSASTRSATGREDSNSCLSGILLCRAAILFSSAPARRIFGAKLRFHWLVKRVFPCCVLSNMIFQIRKSPSCIRWISLPSLPTWPGLWRAAPVLVGASEHGGEAAVPHHPHHLQWSFSDHCKATSELYKWADIKCRRE